MCTRYFIESDLQPALEPVKLTPLTALMQEVFDKCVTIAGEVRPTDIAAVIASNKRGVKTVFPMIWGFTRSVPKPSLPSSQPSSQTIPETQVNGQKPKKKNIAPVVNCRVETAATKELWRDSWLHHRCIIPASYYYEWGHPITLTPVDGRGIGSVDKKNQKKTKYAIQPEEELITYLAGLYRLENGYPHFAVLTREPAEKIRFIHNRMPVVLQEDQVDAWINPQSTLEEINLIAQLAITKMEYVEISS